MSQIIDGTVSVTNGSAQVVGDDEADFSAVVAGDLFTVSGSGVWYTIASTSFSSSLWRLTLQVNYAGTTATGQSFVVQQSFTPFLRLPYPEQGDTETAGVLKRALLLIDALASTGSIGSVSSLDDLRDIVTKDRISLWSVRQLITEGLIEDFQLQTWNGTSVDDGATLIFPNDHNGLTNPVLWVKIR
jgi:hypothetical protein